MRSLQDLESAMEVKMNRPTGYRGKRALDVAVSCVVLAMTAPLLAISAGWVALVMGRPVLFRQRRLGLHAEPFEILKVRTMRDTRDANDKLLPDGERLTRTGRFLRKSSLDELPELVNVLRGEMSLVGPRPLYEKYVPFYRPAELARFDVRPGITGLAQVSGRNHIAWDERLGLDVRYVEDMSLRNDLSILARTIAAVLSGHGVSVDPNEAESDLDDERGAWEGPAGT